MLDPTSEATAYRDLVRGGFLSWSEAIRERGYDPKAVLAEIAKDFGAIESLGIVLDSNPKQVSAAGLTQARPTGTVIPPAGDTRPPEPPAEDGEDDDKEDRLAVEVAELGRMAVAAMERMGDVTLALARRPIPAPVFQIDARTTIERGAIRSITHLQPVQASLPLEAGLDPEAHPAAELTPGQRSALQIIQADYRARETPVTAAFIASKLGVSHERVRQILKRLYDKGFLRGPSSPAIPLE